MTERRKHPGIITEKELQEIKESQIDPRIAECYLNTWINTRHLKAIIERLEAAERVIEIGSHSLSWDGLGNDPEFDAAEIAWHKSRGE